MHSNAQARHSVATKETEEHVQQEALCGTPVLSLHADPAHGYYFLMPSTVWQFSSTRQSNSAPCKHGAEVKVVFTETLNLSRNNVSKASALSYRHLT